MHRCGVTKRSLVWPNATQQRSTVPQTPTRMVRSVHVWSHVGVMSRTRPNRARRPGVRSGRLGRIAVATAVACRCRATLGMMMHGHHALTDAPEPPAGSLYPHSLHGDTGHYSLAACTSGIDEARYPLVTAGLDSLQGGPRDSFSSASVPVPLFGRPTEMGSTESRHVDVPHADGSHPPARLCASRWLFCIPDRETCASPRSRPQPTHEPGGIRRGHGVRTRGLADPLARVRTMARASWPDTVTIWWP